MNRTGPTLVWNGEGPDEPLSNSHNGRAVVPVHSARELAAAYRTKEAVTMNTFYRLAHDAGRGHEVLAAWWRRRAARRITTLRRENARLRRLLIDTRNKQ
ncbi:hypothetical protein [Pseudosporangium ferrugineum]|uniref:Uncharacterized protein n=1 Tax=Pseudosporangium ferrugineum TaxID=439699 RepID=A0A2T0S819_9ACTN|nr:hypothetical protein [Pseudosporangium ferrugineum]PRY29554.1 hypothetical protein CLV70_106275 [Pseudosporangium ferrugineum]